MRERIAVTGLGAFTALGENFATSWKNILKGQSAIRRLEIRDFSEYAQLFDLPALIESISVKVAAPIENEPTNPINPKQLKRCDKATQYALLAAYDALASAQIYDANGPKPFRALETHFPADRRLVAVSPGIGNLNTVVQSWESLRHQGPRAVNPLSIPMLMPNAAAAQISLIINAKAGAHAPVSACASGSEAIALGAQLLALGKADMVLAGGCDAGMHPLSLAAFSRLRALSTQEDPALASRPFATQRDGFVMSEGAAIIVLETESSLNRRNAQPLAWLSGWNTNSDAYDMAPPDPSGEPQSNCVISALHMANLKTTDITHVNAHATSTPAGDAVEAQVIESTCPNAWISATKASTGHLLGAAGALEAAFTVASIKEQVLPPTISNDGKTIVGTKLTPPQAIKLQNSKIDPSCHLPESATRHLPTTTQNGNDNLPNLTDPKLTYALSTSFGFGGHNCALVFTKD